MRIILLLATLIVGTLFGVKAISTMKQIQEQQNNKLCNIDVSYCTQKTDK